jgi:hypothetical protein
MACSESVKEKIDQLAGGELRGLAAIPVERHARDCADCADRLRLGREMNATLRGMAEETPSDALREKILFGVRELAPALDVSATDSASPERNSRRSRESGSTLPHSKGRRRPLLALAGTALTCAVIAAIMFPVFAPGQRDEARKASSNSMASQPSGSGSSYYSGARVEFASSPEMARSAQDYDEAKRQSEVGARDGRPAGGGAPSGFAGGMPSPGKSPIGVQLYNTVQNAAIYASPVQAQDATKSQSESLTRRSEAANPQSGNRNPQSIDRYLIRNAILVLEVKDAKAAHERLLTSVKGTGGYLSNLQETVDGLGVRTITLQVRVPAGMFDGSMGRLAALGKVLERHVTAEDVTEEYVDTDSTVRNLKRTELRLLAHLSRTGKLSDTLLVENELTRVRAEIEQREGRLRFLSHRVSFSTVDVTLREEPKSLPMAPAQSYSSGKEASDAARSLVGFLQSVWSNAIWLGVWSVVWLPLALLGWLLVRFVWRNWFMRL